jgi:hypothetical protein
MSIIDRQRKTSRKHSLRRWQKSVRQRSDRQSRGWDTPMESNTTILSISRRRDGFGRASATIRPHTARAARLCADDKLSGRTPFAAEADGGHCRECCARQRASDQRALSRQVEKGASEPPRKDNAASNRLQHQQARSNNGCDMGAPTFPRKPVTGRCFARVNQMVDSDSLISYSPFRKRSGGPAPPHRRTR